MNQKVIKTIRKFAKLYNFDEKQAKTEFEKMDKPTQIQLVIDMKRAIKEHGK